MMNRKFSSGRSQLIGRGIVYPVPIPLDPVPYEGAVVYGANGQMYLSDGAEWLSIVDEARTAQIAEDVSANVIRVIDEPRDITVHHSNPAADFTSIVQALDSLSGLSRAILPFSLPVRVICLTGHVEQERCWINNPKLPWVFVCSEDEEVLVNEPTACATVDPISTGTAPFMRFSDGIAPGIYCKFVADGGAPSHGSETIGYVLRNASGDVIAATGSGLFEGLNGPSGFDGFDLGFRNVDSPQFRASAAGLTNGCTFNNCRKSSGELYRSSLSARGIQGKGWDDRGLLIANGSRYSEYVNNSDWRAGSSESPNDIVFGTNGGGYASIRPGSQGGTNITPNMTTPAGICLKPGVPEHSQEVITTSNGNYIRHANGMQEAWGVVAIPSRTSMFFDFPAEFSDTPRMSFEAAAGQFTGTGATQRRNIHACRACTGSNNERWRSEFSADLGSPDFSTSYNTAALDADFDAEIAAGREIRVEWRAVGRWY